MDIVRIFCGYAPADEKLVERFKAHLRALEPLNIHIWYASDMKAGTQWERERDNQLRSAQIILLLVSSDFLGSPEQYHKEVLVAMERHHKGEARVIPIILRPVVWQETVLGKLFPLPIGGKPVTDTSWRTQDFAFENIVKGIKSVIYEIKPQSIKQDMKSPPIKQDIVAKLDDIIQNFRALRAQITSFVSLKGPKDFSLTKCEKQYNLLYGETMVFLATYLPQVVASTSEGFVEMVYQETSRRLRKDNLFDTITVFTTRSLIPSLARMEKLGMQLDACIVTLELYKQKIPLT